MRGKYYAIVVLIFLITAGCYYGALEEDYGNSYRAAKYGQMLNPGASKNLASVTGLPGTAADETMKKYTESFAPKQQGPQQTPQGLLMTPLSIGTGKDVYGKQ